MPDSQPHPFEQCRHRFRVVGARSPPRPHSKRGGRFVQFFDFFPGRGQRLAHGPKRLHLAIHPDGRDRIRGLGGSREIADIGTG